MCAIQKRIARFLLAGSLIAVFAVSALSLPIVANAGDNGTFSPDGNDSGLAGSVTYDMEKVTPFEFRGDARDLSMMPPSRVPSRSPHIRPLLKPPLIEKFTGPSAAVESLSIGSPLAPAPGPSRNFAGLSFSDSCTGGQCGAGWPPDPNGDVGRSHYIQAVNDAYAIYDKTGILMAAFTENQLWNDSGSNPCNGDSQGDPIVLYDQLADRWILTHFAHASDGLGNPVSPFYECIAVSKTGDPVAGGWWLYPLRMDPGGTGKPPVGTFNDYPKFGIWSDCLYMAANGFAEPSDSFAGTAYASFSRSDLESGGALTWSLGFLPYPANKVFSMIPSNLLGASPGALPAPGTPNYFVSESLTSFAFDVRKFAAGPNCGGGGTLSGAVSVSQTSYTVPSGAIVPQPGTTNRLDAIDDRLMQKVQYRKVGSGESLWVVHNVRSSPSSTVRPQWAQLDVTGGTIAATPVQQQIYAPDTTLYRWMGSLAVDKDGNMALGYSTSNGSLPNYPSVAYSGRLATDPPNSLSQTETQLVAGLGSQTVTDRWGDYTAMSVDPADDCTFWYTNQYYGSQTNGTSGNWQTRIGSFKFPSCTTTLMVDSINPSGGLTFAFRLKGQVAWQGGATPFSADFNNGDQIEIAPPFVAFSTGRNIQSAVSGCDSVSFWSDDPALSNQIVCSVTMNADKTISVQYSSVNIGPAPSTPSIFWQNQSTVVTWSMDGTNNTGQTSLNIPSGWDVVDVGDFNKDGKSDILLFNQSTGDIFIDYVDGGTVLGGQAGGRVVGNEWKIVGLADFNNDGSPDYLWHNQAAGRLYIWYMGFDDWHGIISEGGAEVSLSGGVTIPDPATWRVAGTGDFNSDGKPDILWQDQGAGDLHLWIMNGTTATGTVYDLTGKGDLNWKVVGIGDFNKDGKPDLLWRNQATGQNEVWFMNGAIKTGSALLDTVADTNWEIVGPK